MNRLRSDADTIIRKAIRDCEPNEIVRKGIAEMPFCNGRIILVAIGKSAWKMSREAVHLLGERIEHGICITKYGYAEGTIPDIEIFEAGHPLVDENAVTATRKAEQLVRDLRSDDMVLMLISGGGSALFEDPYVSLEELQNISEQLLKSGADINEINTVRKRLSSVKAGRFAMLCKPARVFAIIQSDILNDPIDMIASGPCCKDCSTIQDVMNIIQKYHIRVSNRTMNLLKKETPKAIPNAENHVYGSVKQLCSSAMNSARKLGYRPVFLTSSLNIEAKEAGRFLGCIARDHIHNEENIAFIAGGETIVHVRGNGKGGRNQELALSAARYIEGSDNCCIFSFGSDGTDGPTDAAGGYVDGNTAETLCRNSVRISEALNDNDSYHALKKSNGLIVTGPTGTNVNDLAMILIRGK